MSNFKNLQIMFIKLTNVKTMGAMPHNVAELTINTEKIIELQHHTTWSGCDDNEALVILTDDKTVKITEEQYTKLLEVLNTTVTI